jgi:hypothetical protein
MALISLGGVITDIRGKVKGSVFSRNDSGNVLRNKTVPKIYVNQYAALCKSRMQLLMRSWLNLEQESRDTWELGRSNFQFTNKLGNPITPQANVLFSTLNFNRLLCELNVIEECPDVYPLPSITDIERLFIDGFWQLSINLQLTGFNSFVLVYGSKPIKRTQNSKGLSTQVFLGFKFIDDNGILVNVQELWEKRFNLTFIDNNVLITLKTMNLDSGQTSNITQFLSLQN